MRLWVENLGVDTFIHGTQVEPTSDIDLGAPESLFVAQALDEIDKLQEPYFLTIQLSNTHYPYLVDPAGPQPFQPAKSGKAPSDNDAFFNHYQNAVHQQDQHLARLLDALKLAHGGDRTAVVYTSDHGEAFREHHQLGHTFSLYDEEVKVPGFVDVPAGLITAQQRAHLEAKKDSFVYHPDLTATVLDLLGVWQDTKIQVFRKKMLGVSLLDADANVRPLPMTNCAGVWSCAYENWGFIQGPKKLFARARDTNYSCYDLQSDPEEKRLLPLSACGQLAGLARSQFGRLPGLRD